jgi:hypothetical protein
MKRPVWSWVWFALAAILVFATLGYEGTIIGGHKAIERIIHSPQFAAHHGDYIVSELRRQNSIAGTKIAILLVFAALSLGTGLRSMYKLPFAGAYVLAFIICPIAAAAFPLCLMVLRSFSHR